MAVKRKQEIPEEKIRQVIWKLKRGHTKKSCCEHLGIAYNTKKLELIIDTHKHKEELNKKLRKDRSKTPFTKEEEDYIINRYIDGDSQSGIANDFHASAQRIKKVLLENNVPIRSRKKTGVAKTDHIIQDLDILFKTGDKVFIPIKNETGTILTVFDEDWVEYYSEPIRKKYVELPPLQSAKKKYGEDYEGKPDIHYNIYWQYDNGEEWKEESIISKINQVSSMIESTGREYYRIKVIGDHTYITDKSRENIFPIKGH